MAGIFCRGQLARHWFDCLESGSGEHGQLYFSRKLPAYGASIDGRDILATVDFDAFLGKGFAVDFGNYGLHLFAGLGIGVGIKWRFDFGTFDFVGGV
jgi:hypothetical protein